MDTTSEKQAEAAKRKGNLYFKKEKLGAAIEAYTEAITLCPRVPIYWTNRALCERKRNEWEKVEADCKKALELDNSSVKGHYMLGLALLHYQQYGRAVAELEKALDLGRGAKHGTSYMVEEIWQELAKARYTQWDEDALSRKQQLQDLQTFLQHLMKTDHHRRLKEIISIMVSSEDLPPPPDESPSREESIPEDEEFRHPGPDVAEEKIRRSASTEQEKVGEGRGNLYPPIYGQDEDFNHTHEAPEREEGEQFADDNYQKPSVRVESEGVKGGETDEQKKPRVPGFRPSVQRSKSLQIRLQQFMESGYFQQDGAADSPNGFQFKRNTNQDSSDEKVPYSIYDVYKIFKELVKLQREKAGHELLRTTELYERRSKALNDLFKKLAGPDIPGEIPDHLCCSITMEIFRDPVITPSGITYERAALQEHLKQVGAFDPVTRSPLTIEQAYPNLAIRDAVQVYLADHGWAYRT